MMIPAVGCDREPSTTSGAIAVVNLHAQIDGLAARALPASSAPGSSAADWLVLIDLLTLRGQVLGRIADYERAAELAEQLVRGGGAGGGGADDGAALPARARTRATFHRFADALADLDAAEDRGGCDRAALAAERAVILQATGSGAEAGKLHRRAVVDRPGFAEGLFDQARGRYLGTSPFPVASLDFRRGLMWRREGNLPAGLACALSAAGQRRAAGQWRTIAAARYDELARRHPHAYAGHAADFRHLGGGGAGYTRWHRG